MQQDDSETKYVHHYVLFEAAVLLKAIEYNSSPSALCSLFVTVVLLLALKTCLRAVCVAEHT
jgi:hypothetical protein